MKVKSKKKKLKKEKVLIWHGTDEALKLGETAKNVAPLMVRPLRESGGGG